MNEQLQEISERIKNFKINISEKKKKCLRYRHNLKQKRDLLGEYKTSQCPNIDIFLTKIRDMQKHYV